jgi:ribose-phosphate pyrophosphokinase
MNSKKSFKLLSGRSNPTLAKNISAFLGIPLTKCRLDDFGNTELRVEILESVRGFDMFILQTGGYDNEHSVNDYLIELICMINACKLSSCKSITVIIPCFPYARSDKKDTPRVPIVASLVTTILESIGVDRIVSMDLHAGQIQGFGRIPFDNLFAINLHIETLRNSLFKNLTTEQINEKYILVSPDNGGIKRIEAYAKRMNMSFVIMHKQRDYSQKSVVMNSMIIGDTKLEGKIALILDDMIDTCGTMVSASNELQKHGTKKVIIIATHGIFSGPAMERINGCDAIEQVIVTNTLSQIENAKKCSKLVIVDTSGTFAEVIKRLIDGSSISELFAPSKSL